MAERVIEKQVKYKYPSRFGTHASMVVSEADGMVVCEDEFGQYTTLKNRVDNGCADPNRYTERRISKMFQGVASKDD